MEGMKFSFLKHVIYWLNESCDNFLFQADAIMVGMHKNDRYTAQIRLYGFKFSGKL